MLAAWYVGDALIQLTTYNRLTEKTAPDTIAFHTTESSFGKFYLTGSYTFTFQGLKFDGKTTLDAPLFRNRLVADEEALIYASKPHTVLFDPKSPNISSLQKKYPLKELIYAAILSSLFVYFIFLWFRTSRSII